MSRVVRTAGETAGQVRLEAMAPNHLDEVAAIEEMCSSQPWSRSLFAGELEQEQPYLVAVGGEADSEPTVLGFAGYIQLSDDAHVTNVAVHPGARRRGIARRLLVALLTDAIGRGVRDVTLEVRASNEPALSLYRTFGFAPEGVRPRYYSDPTENAVLLWARDIGHPLYRLRLEKLGGAR